MVNHVQRTGLHEIQLEPRRVCKTWLDTIWFHVLANKTIATVALWTYCEKFKGFHPNVKRRMN